MSRIQRRDHGRAEQLSASRQEAKLLIVTEAVVIEECSNSLELFCATCNVLLSLGVVKMDVF
jgi:hypothetical protein